VPEYDKSVFINCPNDDLFERLFHALVLAIAALGFTPRCARDSEGQADPRMVRISKGLSESKYSIHDLSRFQGEGPQNLARFNMPMELGIAHGMRSLRPETGSSHNWLVFVPKDFVHLKFISDLAGFDVPQQDGQPATIVREVAKWLSLQPDFEPPVPTAKTILGAYPAFCTLLDAAKADALGTLTWPAIVKAAESVVSAMAT
jgi:hypothetical protein